MDIVKPITLTPLEPILFEESVQGCQNDRFYVECKNGEEWNNLPIRAEIRGEACYKDSWNSVKEVAFYRLDDK